MNSIKFVVIILTVVGLFVAYEIGQMPGMICGLCAGWIMNEH